MDITMSIKREMPTVIRNKKDIMMIIGTMAEGVTLEMAIIMEDEVAGEINS